MDPVLYYRRALFFPLIIFAVMTLVPFFGLSKIGFWALAVGGVPYLLLALFLFQRSRVVAFRSFWVMILISPLLLAPLVIVWCFLLGLILDEQEASALISVFGSVLAVIFGYLFIGGAVIVRKMMERKN